MHDLFRYFYSGATFAITEMDGVRVIGQEASDFIQKVPGMLLHCTTSYLLVGLPFS